MLAAEAVADALVVTNDPTLQAEATAIGAKVVADGPDAGLNAAIAHGEATLGFAGRARRAHGRPARAATGRSDRRASPRRSASGEAARRFVPDHVGTGTTLLLAPPAVPLDPHFGLDSAAAHAASGAAGPHRRLAVAAPRRRHPGRSAGGAARWGSADARRPAYDRAACRAPSRPTIRRPGAAPCCSTTAPRLTFDGAAFATSGLRLLRFGQRLRLDLRRHRPGDRAQRADHVDAGDTRRIPARGPSSSPFARHDGRCEPDSTAIAQRLRNPRKQRKRTQPRR